MFSRIKSDSAVRSGSVFVFNSTFVFTYARACICAYVPYAVYQSVSQSVSQCISVSPVRSSADMSRVHEHSAP